MIKKYLLLCAILVSSYIKTSYIYYVPTVHSIAFQPQANSQSEIDIMHQITGPSQLCYESANNRYLYLYPITLLIIVKPKTTDMRSLDNPNKSLSSYDRSPYFNDMKVTPNPHKNFPSENLLFPKTILPQSSAHYATSQNIDNKIQVNPNNQRSQQSYIAPTNQSDHQKKLLSILPPPIIGPPGK